MKNLSVIVERKVNIRLRNNFETVDIHMFSPRRKQIFDVSVGNSFFSVENKFEFSVFKPDECPRNADVNLVDRRF